MLETLITSKTRIKLLLKFFLNTNTQAWLRSLESEFGESSNAIRLELNRFEQAGLLQSSYRGNKKIYKANTEHPLFPEIHKLLMKYIGLDKILDKVVSKLGQLEKVYLVGEFAKGKSSKMIDIWFIGNEIDKNYLLNLVEKTEQMIDRKIRYIILNSNELKEFREVKEKDEIFLIWKS